MADTEKTVEPGLDQDANQKFIRRCGKTYLLKSWFDNDTAKCKGEPKEKPTKSKPIKRLLEYRKNDLTEKKQDKTLELSKHWQK